MGGGKERQTSRNCNNYTSNVARESGHARRRSFLFRSRRKVSASFEKIISRSRSIIAPSEAGELDAYWNVSSLLAARTIIISRLNCCKIYTAKERGEISSAAFQRRNSISRSKTRRTRYHRRQKCNESELLDRCRFFEGIRALIPLTRAFPRKNAILGKRSEKIVGPRIMSRYSTRRLSLYAFSYALT